MSEHAITGIKMSKKGDDLVISAMTKSPRGTTVPFKSIVINGDRKDKQEFKRRVETALNQLLSKAE